MGFDPNNFNPNDHSSGGSNDPLPTGTYLLWVRSFKRKHANGKDGILFIVDAFAKGDGTRIPKDQFAPVFENVTLTEAAAWRFADLCNAVGRTSPFNAMNDGELSSVVKRKPFKATIKHEMYQGQPQPRIDKYLTFGAEDMKVAEAVLEDMAVDSAAGGGYDDTNPSGGGGGGYTGGGGGDFTDDDIPF
jgi:hypothetical protein